MRASLLLPCMLLPGCLVQNLWQADLRGEIGVDVTTARFEVAALTVAERTDAEAQSGAVPARELVLDAVMRDGRLGGETSWMVRSRQTFVLRPFEPSGPDAVAGLLRDQVVGTVDRCNLSIDWSSGIDTDPYFSAAVELEGWLSPRLWRARVDAAKAADMLASPAAVTAGDSSPALLARLEGVDYVDWRVLCPEEPDGKARVLACFFDPDTRIDTAADPFAGVDALLQVGPVDRHCCLLVPVAALPLLAHIHRVSDTLLPRFRCEQRFLAVLRPGSEPRSGPLPLPAGTMLVLNSRLHSQVDWGHAFRIKEVLTPLAAVGDAALWLLDHGPFPGILPKKAPAGSGGKRSGG